MTDGQWRVLYILIAAFGIELLSAPLTQNIVAGITGGTPISGTLPLGQQLGDTTLATISFGIGVLLLLLLASAAPNVATWIAVIILLSITIRQQATIVALVNKAADGLNTLRTKP